MHKCVKKLMYTSNVKGPQVSSGLDRLQLIVTEGLYQSKAVTEGVTASPQEQLPLLGAMTSDAPSSEAAVPRM